MSPATLETGDTGARPERGWWVREETAWCPFCWQGYAWELQVVCIGCDRPACPCCSDHAADPGPRCPECAGEEVSA